MPLRVSISILGAWLFVSGLLWPHDGLQLLNAWICGDLSLILALLGSRRGPQLIGLWMIVTSVFLPSWHPATPYNHVLVGSMLFTLPLFRDAGA